MSDLAGARQLLAHYRQRGLLFRIKEDGTLGLRGNVDLSDEDKAALREHKESLLDLLWREPHPSDGRALGWPHESKNWNGSSWNWRPVKEESREQEEGEG